MEIEEVETMAIILNENQLFKNLTNLALVIHHYPTNNSGKPKRFVDIFMTETIANGDTKIFPVSDLPEVVEYSETSTITTVTKPTVSESYLQISEKKVVKTSIPKYVLEMAFTSDSGMNEFTGYIIGQTEHAKTNYMYDLVLSDLFGKELIGEQLQEVTLMPTTATTAVEANAVDLINQKRIKLAIQDIIDGMQVYSNKYNDLGYTENIERKDLVFIYCQPWYNQQVVDLVASLLRSNVINEELEEPDIVTIPKIKIPTGQQNVIGFVMHRKVYQLFYKFVSMLNFFDVSNLYVNYFLHFWLGHGFVKGLPMVKIIAKTAA